MSEQPAASAIVSERRIEQMQVLLERLDAKAIKHEDPEIRSIRDDLWLHIRVIRGDTDLSQDDIF